MTGSLLARTESAHRKGQRILAPLIGLPGVRLAHTTVKLAQQNPSIHSRVLSSIVKTFAPDIVFPLMELAVEANALGWKTNFPVDEPPTVEKTPFQPSDLNSLESVDIRSDSRVRAYCETVRRAADQVPPSVILGAYVTGPYTLAALMMGTEEAAIATKLHKAELHGLLAFTNRTIDTYMRSLIEASAGLICILEPTAMMLGPSEFKEFSADYVRSLRLTCDQAGNPTVLHICGRSMHLIEHMASTGVDGLSLDSQESGVDLAEAIQRVPRETVILGNISPTETMLFGNPELVRREVWNLADRLCEFPNFALSTGCDLPLDTPLENVYAFMDAGRRLRREESLPC
jgi:uroporphyrinogen decarboxylase